MLKEIFIENYKSLKNAKVEFKDGLNIIIGKNGSGKSNLLEFINMVIGTEIFFKFDFQNFRFPEYNFGYTFIYKDELENKNKLVIKLPSDQRPSEINSGKTIFISKKDADGKELNSQTVFSDGANYKLNNTIKLPKGAVGNGISEFTTVLFILQNIDGLLNNYLKFNIPKEMFWFDIPSTMSIDNFGLISEVISYDNLFSYGFHYFIQTKIVNDFSNVPSDDQDVDKFKTFFFDSFSEYKNNVEIERFLSTYSPIEDIKISSNANIYKLPDKVIIENLTFDYKVNGIWIPWSHLSDGTKRLFYIISQTCCQKNGLILIEEPELGIHPHQLYKLMQFIKEQSEHKQIIISTHSPLILDTLEADELDRIIVAKIENGKSQFHKLSDQEIEKAKVYMHEQMDLSFYWLHSDLEEA